MKKILVIITILWSFVASAQFSKPMNWSAIITDNSGNPLISTNVNLKFSISNDISGELQYSEEQTQLTDTNGFINAIIGIGTPTFGQFNAPYWTSENIKLKVEADTGDGFVTLSDEAVAAVPLANKAISSSFLQFENNYLIISQIPGGPNEMGFILNNSQVGTLKNNGTLQLLSLSGAGEGDVVVNASGELQRKTIETKHLAISGAAFSNSEFIFIPAYSALLRANQLSQNAADLSSNINLPSNAKVTGLKVIYLDNSVTRGFNLGLYHTNASNTSSFIVGFNTDATTPSAAFQTWDSPTLNHTVDNFNNSYYITVNSNDWQTGLELGLLKIVITYEE